MKNSDTQFQNVHDLIGKMTQITESLGPDDLLFFRGHESNQFEVLPSIYRETHWITNEDRMIREIIMRCPGEFNAMASSFEKLVKMQHYGLPTRLLDLTSNPLIALWFACQQWKGKSPEESPDENHNGGELLIFKIPKSEIKYFDSDTVSVISNIAWTKENFQIMQGCDGTPTNWNKKTNNHALQHLHFIKQEKPYFLEKVNPKHLQSVVCVRAKMDNPRIVRQDGAFLLFGMGSSKRKSASVPADWRYSSEGERFIIKEEDKPKILEQLVSIGVSKASIFPEIDMVAQFIRDDPGLNDKDFVRESNAFKPTIVIGRRQR